MAKTGHYILVYDISNNKERSKTSKVLEGFGKRVQESVFECSLTTGTKKRLEKKLERLDIKSGFILCYRLNKSAKKSTFGNAPPDISAPEPHSFIV
ncbi:MAG TPA: CRISPR-associated endonuclease Cas2 [Desulfocapsa sulfexigens]|nr:CRISPR-associated endonuclease Cas2 [Desulfocapsa sulfexigens]